MTANTDKADEKIVRKIFVKHSMEKSEELELFDTDAIITDIAKLIAKLKEKQEEK